MSKILLHLRLRLLEESTEEIDREREDDRRVLLRTAKHHTCGSVVEGNATQYSAYWIWRPHDEREDTMADLIELSVWRYRSCKADGDSAITSAASFSALDAFCSPSATIT